jgi:Ni,Fe-hydrogenase I large subunit
MRSGLDSVAAHLPAALTARRQAHEMGAVFSGKMPGTNSIIPGGFTAVPTSAAIDKYRKHLQTLTTFIREVYLADVMKVGEVYSDYFQIGGGCKNLMAFGVFEMDDINTCHGVGCGTCASAMVAATLLSGGSFAAASGCGSPFRTVAVS